MPAPLISRSWAEVGCQLASCSSVMVLFFVTHISAELPDDDRHQQLASCCDVVLRPLYHHRGAAKRNGCPAWWGRSTATATTHVSA
ncbi:hypothetical protein BDZ90DRAFT_229901 [Jaminaea rosea]|uniref:Uncharacterized protein n=1 Tax=Jaminaea rosea TaxID=1569628 RepID=A0A316V031_9BASI|nr:hypothetical protein BDZ90DRAFT_229901 [Jaminaea rosea]PWN30910.1 hypothetical protein BDZ90DRAFT_229901 [Jaminaea rosea]